MDISLNLWHFFPESLLDITTIFKLPYLVMLLYIGLFYIALNKLKTHITLVFFCIFSIAASTMMLINLQHSMGNIVPPLVLFSLVLMPLIQFIIKLYNHDYLNASIWLTATLAAYFHGISWCVWFFAIARS